MHCKPVDVEGNLGVAGAGRQPMRRMQGEREGEGEGEGEGGGEGRRESEKEGG